jgi:exodeoxyribonuclease VII small subunit
MDRLRELVEKIEQGQIDVDELSKAVNEAAGIIQSCRQRLRKTEDEVNKALETMESLEAPPTDSVTGNSASDDEFDPFAS